MSDLIDRFGPLAALVILAILLVRLLQALTRTNDQLLATATVTSPQAYREVRAVDKPDTGLHPSRQAMHDQEMAMRRDEDIKARALEEANEQMRRMGFDNPEMPYGLG